MRPHVAELRERHRDLPASVVGDRRVWATHSCRLTSILNLDVPPPSNGGWPLRPLIGWLSGPREPQLVPGCSGHPGAWCPVVSCSVPPRTRWVPALVGSPLRRQELGAVLLTLLSGFPCSLHRVASPSPAAGSQDLTVTAGRAPSCSGFT